MAVRRAPRIGRSWSVLAGSADWTVSVLRLPTGRRCRWCSSRVVRDRCLDGPAVEPVEHVVVVGLEPLVSQVVSLGHVAVGVVVVADFTEPADRAGAGGQDAVEQSGGGPVGAGGDHAVAEALAFELAGAVSGLGRPVRPRRRPRSRR